MKTIKKIGFFLFRAFMNIFPYVLGAIVLGMFIYGAYVLFNY